MRRQTTLHFRKGDWHDLYRHSDPIGKDFEKGERAHRHRYLVTAGDGGLIDSTLRDHFAHLDRQTMNV